MTEPTEAEIEEAAVSMRRAISDFRAHNDASLAADGLWPDRSARPSFEALARAALAAAAQVREGQSQENMTIGTLGTIANMPDEDDEWDGTDKFHKAREMAKTVMAHLPPAAPALMPIYASTEDQG